MTAGRLADRIGRLAVMKLAAVLFFISAIGTAFATSVWLIVLFRIVGGIGVGVASVIAPAYIAETSPPHIRGRLGSLQQLAIVIGHLPVPGGRLDARHIWPVAPIEELWLGMEAWRWMFLMHGDPGRRLRAAGVHHSRVAALPRCHAPDSGSPQGADHAAGGDEPRRSRSTGSRRPWSAETAAVVARSAQARTAGSTASSGSASDCRSSSSSSAST